MEEVVDLEVDLLCSFFMEKYYKNFIRRMPYNFKNKLQNENLMIFRKLLNFIISDAKTAKIYVFR